MENIIIIGAGPAGISAALYAARGNMDPVHWKKRRRSRTITDWSSRCPAESFSKEVLPRQEHLEYGSWMTRLWEWVVLILLR